MRHAIRTRLAVGSAALIAVGALGWLTGSMIAPIPGAGAIDDSAGAVIDLSSMNVIEIALTAKSDQERRKHLLDLGDVQCGMTARGIIRIVNDTPRRATIDEIITTCACTAPVPPRRTIGPDEALDLSISLPASTIRGRTRSKTIAVQFVEKHLDPVIIDVHCRAREFISVDPPRVAVRADHEQYQITLSSTDGQPFGIVRIEPEIEAQITPADEASESHEIILDARVHPKGSLPKVLTVHLDHPGAEAIEIELIDAR